MTVLSTLGFILSNLILSGCAVGPDFEEPCPPEVKSYTEKKLPGRTAGTPASPSQQFVQAKEIPSKWWTLFRSKELNWLIEAGIHNSPNLDAAVAALNQSQANLRAYIGSSFFPAINGSYNEQRERINDTSLGLENAKPQIFNLYNASVNVTYTLDVFGGLRRGMEALEAQVDYRYFLTQGAYLSLTSNIVTTAITEASIRAQIQATKELIAINENLLSIVQQQMNLGSVSQVAVLSQQTLLEQTKATLPPLEKNLSVARHALSALVGVFPSDKLLPNFYLNHMTLPIQVPVSLPSKLVQQRPDILAAEALLHQASANIGVAIANMLPQVTLTGMYGQESNHIADLFKGVWNIWSYGGQLLQPIFQGGALIAKRRAAIDAYDVACAQYRQTVLTAFQNVADSLRAIETDARTLKIQTAAEEAAKKTLEITEEQFKLGGVNYLNLLNAQQQYQLAKIKRIQAESARLSDTAALFQALGGGWWDCE